MRDRGHRLNVVLVHIGDFVHGGIVYCSIIIYISYIYDVHGGIRDVHLLHVAFAGAIRRNVHFAWTEREPGHASPSATERNRRAEARSADEHNQGRRIHGPNHYRSRNPTPASPDLSPASVVKWSEAPGLVFHPGPSPGCNPDPVPVSVGRPPGNDVRGKPYVSVIWNVPPLAVLIEIVISDDVAGDVACGFRALFAVVAGVAPIVKFIEASGLSAVVCQRIRAAKIGLIAGVHVVFAAPAGGFPFALAHGNRCRVAIGVDIDAIITGALESEGKVRRVYLKRVATFDPAHVNVQRSLRKLDLNGAIIQVQESYTRLAADSNRRAAYVKFAARVSIGPQIVAYGERAVGIRLNPIRFTAWLEGERSLDVVEAGHSSRRIVVRQGGRGRRE